MSARIIDGKAFAAKIREEVRSSVQKRAAEGKKTTGLAVVLVGEDPASQVYVRNKEIAAEAVGFQSFIYRLPEDIPQSALEALIAELNQNPAIDGILVQLPLPAHLDKDAIIASIAAHKDVDGFHPNNVGKLWLGEKTVVPCTPLGCSLIIQEHMGSNLEGKIAVVIGASTIVGKPMAALLMQMRATVTVCNSKTPNIAQLAKTADILVVAAGRAELVQGDWIKSGALVLDVGINRVHRDGKDALVGDVNFAQAQAMASAITPVPGGIGPMTIACLLKNTLQLQEETEKNFILQTKGYEND